MSMDVKGAGNFLSRTGIWLGVSGDCMKIEKRPCKTRS
jgi:hypothetical protein